MVRRVPQAMVGLVLALCTLAASPTGAAGHGRSAHASAALLGGVNIIPLGPDSLLAEADGAIAQAHALHAKVVRTEVPWSAFEPLEPGTSTRAPRPSPIVW